MNLSFQNSNPAHTDFQYLEDLATAYWYSEVLFASIELGIFEAIDADGIFTQELAERLECDEHDLLRILNVLERISLIYRYEDKWFNSLISAGYLSKKNTDEYMGDFLLYRKYMQPNWRNIVRKISLKDISEQDNYNDNYVNRNLAYVKSADRLMLQKAKDVCEIISQFNWKGPVLDIGGGAGSLLRQILKSSARADERGVLFDLPEVIDAAELLYGSEYCCDIETGKGDFRKHDFGEERFGLVIMSNFLHAYSQVEAREILEKSMDILREDGLLLIHDYFPDRASSSPHKGVLYDINMMLNTYNGECHESTIIKSWLVNAGIGNIISRDLSTDTSLIIASKNNFSDTGLTGQITDDIIYAAKKTGLYAVPLNTESIIVQPWVRIKCRFGCESFGKKLQCPPYPPDHVKTSEIINSYKYALLVQGAPPGNQFHESLLKLEKSAFLSGYHKALAFGAGPCPVCSECPDDGKCRYPEKSRPSMEASGIDVFQTARNTGINLNPVRINEQYVKYFALLLLE